MFGYEVFNEDGQVGDGHIAPRAVSI